MTNEPLYLGTFEDARQAGEQEAWTASRNANIACRDAIDKEIAQNFDGLSLGSGVVDRVVQEFGADRVKYVLATNIQDMAWDGRISPSNKGWAANAPAATEPFRVAELRLRCHPAVLDGYIRMFRRLGGGRRAQVRSTRALFGAFPFVVVALRQQGFLLRSENPSKIAPCGVRSSFWRADRRSGKEKPAENTLCIVKGFDAAWASIRRQKPTWACLPSP